ncbi:hypothetical protein RHGRI_035208 [Rhododendron griersonianum]|uniref:Uncharacterized protein n=1 Tax=Rhododendron griersonianum TaxID=479676 RepID=A0AAV6I3R1_9ERIC|nr:hypothetical protein RHGRI_035208 [Rhododendron griersonianum]
MGYNIVATKLRIIPFLKLEMGYILGGVGSGEVGMALVMTNMSKCFTFVSFIDGSFGMVCNLSHSHSGCSSTTLVG